jgi:hypothetical protein
VRRRSLRGGLPTLAAAFSSSRSADGRCAFADRLEDELKHRLLRRPAPLDVFAATFVVAKKHVEGRTPQ